MSDNTEIQPDDSQSASARMSMPKDVEQHPQAPKIPGYVLVATIGKGAFAEVWKAWQVRTHKWVAVKVFIQKTGVNWLFLQREVERLIRLDKHPHIVSLLDADLEGEIPYYVMDYMEGGSLEQFVDPRRAIGPAQAALWMEEMAQALAYVHAKGLIHCDLKPANVLLDGEGHVRLADFGQSRIVTDSSGALGTLFYMAPEQAVMVKAGEPLQPDVQWDVFGLGATLWAIVTGRVPRGDEAGRDALDAAPSLEARLAVYRRIVTARSLANCQLENPSIDEDLAAVIDRCSDATSLLRYDAVQDVLADLGARRENRPVKPLAHRAGYRVRKFARRNAALVALGAFAGAVLAGAFAQIIKERDSVRRELSVAYLSRAQRAARDADWAAAALLNAQANKIYPSDVARWNAASGLADLAVPAAVISTPDPKAGGIFLAPDFKTILMAGTTEVALVDFKTRLPIGDRIVPGDVLRSAAYSADGGFVATANDRGELRLWDARTGRPAGPVIKKADEKVKDKFMLGRMRLIGSVEGGRLAVGAGGRTILSSVYNDVARQWDPKSGKKLREGAWPNSVENVVYSRDGTAAAGIGYSGVAVWKTGDGSHTLLKLDAPGFSVAFSPDGARLATGGEDGLSLWDLNTNTRIGRWDAGKAVVTAVAFSSKGDLAIGCQDGRAVLWDVAKGAATGRWMMHPEPVTTILFNVDGSSLATISDRTLRLWDLKSGWSRRREFTLPGYYPNAEVATYTADGRYIMTVAGTSRDVERYDAVTLRPEGKPQVLPKTEMISKVTFNPDRTAGLLTDYKNGSRLWDFRSGKMIGAREVHGSGVVGITLVVFSPDGRSVLTVPWEGHSRLWDAGTGAPLGRPLVHAGPVRGAAFSPDSRWVVTGSTDTTARIWDARTGEAIGRALPHAREVYPIAVSPDGDTIATSTWNDVQLWSAKTQAQVGRPFAHPSTVMNMTFSRDGRKLLVGAADHKARLWDVRSHSPIGKAMSHDSFLHALKFSPDDKLVLTSSWDKTARVWDAATGEPVGEPMRFPEGVTYAEFSPDGKTVLAGGGGSGNVTLWDVSWLGELASPDEVVRRAQAVTLRRLNERGDVEVSAPAP